MFLPAFFCFLSPFRFCKALHVLNINRFTPSLVTRTTILSRRFQPPHETRTHRFFATVKKRNRPYAAAAITWRPGTEPMLLPQARGSKRRALGQTRRVRAGQRALPPRCGRLHQACQGSGNVAGGRRGGSWGCQHGGSSRWRTFVH